MSDAVLTLYGVPASQPSRAVYWTCLIKGLAFELRTPELLGADKSDLAELNPKRQVPTLVQGDFVLYEMPAILAWLCNANTGANTDTNANTSGHGNADGWDHLYPMQPSARALVDQYLHFHHSTTRLATIKLMAPHVTIAFGGIPEGGKDILLGEGIRAAMGGPDVYERGRAVIQMVAELIEAGYLREPGGYLCSRERPTIADIACYEELSQLRWASLFDFEQFPKLQAWLDRMAALPFHENVHRYNVVLGDILSSPNTMQRFIDANTAGVAALEELGVATDREEDMP